MEDLGVSRPSHGAKNILEDLARTERNKRCIIDEHWCPVQSAGLVPNENGGHTKLFSGRFEKRCLCCLVDATKLHRTDCLLG